MVTVTNLARTLETLKAEGFWCIGLDGQGEDSCATLKTYNKLALVLGAEGDGMRRLTRTHCDLMVKIPTQSEFCSLNVSNAAAIAFFCAKPDAF
jgi:23S rRNA (guanosine2251-2'-O)-methyltransferase